MEKTELLKVDPGVAVQDVKQVSKHGNIVTNLLRSKIERNLHDQIYQENNIWNHPEGETSYEDESDLIICYEPLDENKLNDEETLMGTTFKLLENFFLSYPDLFNEMLSQLQNHQKPKIYKTYLRKCRICQRAFTNQKELDDHKQLHFQMDRSFRCKTCKKLFFDIRNLKNHERVHIRENSKCNICLKEFRFIKYLDQHMVQHHGASPGTSELKQVVETNEDSEDEVTYPCVHCGKVFRNRSKLITHTNMHFQYKPYKCKKCPKAFTKQENLRAHLASHKTHQDIMTKGVTFPCGQCGRVFRNQAKLDDHDSIHAGFKPYKCKQCGTAFLVRENLEKHMVNHKKEVIKLYNCEYCSQTFYYLGKINEHMLKCHPDALPYSCEDCGLKFPRSESLEIHEKSHVINPEVPACNVCNKSYQSNFSLRRHMNMFHNGEENLTK